MLLLIYLLTYLLTYLNMSVKFSFEIFQKLQKIVVVYFLPHHVCSVKY